MGLWVCGMDGYDQIPLPMNRWLTQIALVGPGGPLISHKAARAGPEGVSNTLGGDRSEIRQEIGEFRVAKK